MRVISVIVLAALTVGGFVPCVQAAPLVLSYSGVIENDGIHGAAFFDYAPMPSTVSYSFQAVFDPASPAIVTSGIPLGPGQVAFVASNISFSIAGYGNFSVVPGSYYVTAQDTTGGGLFGYFVNTYAVGLDEPSDPGAGAFLTGFASAMPHFSIASPAATVFAGDQGAIAEMYTPFTTGDEFAFLIPSPIPGAGSASITVPEPSSIAVLVTGLLAWLMWRHPSAARWECRGRHAAYANTGGALSVTSQRS